METSPLVLGVLAGLAVAVPVGPIAVLLLREGVVHGTRVALGAGLGIATVDLLYAVVALVAGAQVARVVADHEVVVRWVTTIVLVVVGVVMLRGWWRERPAVRAGEESGPGDLVGTDAVDVDRTRVDDRTRVGVRTRVLAATPGATYLRFVALTVVNPATALIFATVAVALAGGVGASTGGAGLVQGALFVVGAAAASAVWQSTLAVASGTLGRAVGERGRSWASALGAVVVLVLAGLVAVG